MIVEKAIVIPYVRGAKRVKAYETVVDDELRRQIRHGEIQVIKSWKENSKEAPDGNRSRDLPGREAADPAQAD